MRARFHVAIGAIALAGVGCTAFVAANLSGTNGTVDKSIGGCFKLADTTCGECIANNCENPDDPTQPVSLEKVCSLDQTASIIDEAQTCSASASIDDYNCTDLFVDGGTYASSIDDESAAVNNVKQCITQKCATSCSRCVVQVPTCGSDTIDLTEAGTCGNCIDQAMNAPGSACQPFVLQGECSTYPSSPIATCAVPSGSCQTSDCTTLAAADAGLNGCLWGQCGSSCPNP